MFSNYLLQIKLLNTDIFYDRQNKRYFKLFIEILLDLI